MPVEKKREKVKFNKVVVVTKALLKNKPQLKPFWQPRHERTLSDSFINDVREKGLLQDPILVRFEGDLVAVAGNRRVRAALAAGIEEGYASVLQQLDWDEVRKIQVAENEQREGNSIEDKIHNILAFLQLDDKGKPQGMSYAEVGQMFDYSHQTIRDLALMGTVAPKWLRDGIEANQISLTEATKLVKANIANNGDDKTLKESYEKHISSTVMSASGNPIKKKAERKAPKPKPSPALVNHWGTSKATPQQYRLLIQTIQGDISIPDARRLAKGAFDAWMVAEVPKEPKKQPKAKDQPTITAEDVEEPPLISQAEIDSQLDEPSVTVESAEDAETDA